MELGISSFGEITPDRSAGYALNAHKRVQELLEEIKLADEVGLDVFALGEHHRPDFVVSSPETILAAAAAITKNIKLSSSVTVLSSADPVRTFQQFATLDLISNGRAEIMAGRGSFIESFPLFGYDLKNYDELFVEKLTLLLQINEQEVVNWKGKFRPAIPQRGVYPRPIQGKLPVWLAAGGTPASAKRAGKLNLPLTIAILGGPPNGFVPFANLYRQAAQEAGHDVSQLQLAISTHFFAADESEQASDDLYPTYEQMMNRIGRERGWSPIERQDFESLRRGGPLMVGDTQEIIDKILYMHELFNNTRYLAQLIGGEIPHHKVMHAIELFGTKIAPAVRKALGGNAPK
jgi:probable LLM family oxidoreductase